MRRAAAAALVLLWATSAHAHKPSDSYLTLESGSAGLAGQWDIALRDLDDAIGLDGDDDGAITWGELRSRQAAVAAYALARLQIEADGAACANRPGELLVDHHTDGGYVVLRFTVECPRPPHHLSLRYSLFFDRDPQHRGLLFLRAGGATQTRLFSAAQRQHAMELSADNWSGVADGWRAGIRQAVTGVEGLLFLLALLLPAERGRRSVTARVLLSMAVAQSIGLALLGLRIVQPPVAVVDPAIAAALALTLLVALAPGRFISRALLAVGFGLLHGGQQAAAVAGDRLGPALLCNLLGFSAGLQVGQLLIVVGCLALVHALPPLHRLRWNGAPLPLP